MPWAGLGRLLGPSRSILQPLGPVLKASWSLLGCSWGCLGASWAPFGSLLGPLGRLLGRLEGDPKQHEHDMQKKSNFQTSKKRIHQTFWTPYGRPKSTKIGSKTRQNLRRFSRAKKLLFKSLLEPSWADLRAFWDASWGSKIRCGIGRRSVW